MKKDILELKFESTMKGLLILGEFQKFKEQLIIKQTENLKFQIDKKNNTIRVKFKKHNKEFFFVDNDWKKYDSMFLDYKDLKMIYNFTSWLLVNVKQRGTVLKSNHYKLAYKQLIKN